MQGKCNVRLGRLEALTRLSQGSKPPEFKGRVPPPEGNVDTRPRVLVLSVLTCWLSAWCHPQSTTRCLKTKKTTPRKKTFPSVIRFFSRVGSCHSHAHLRVEARRGRRIRVRTVPFRGFGAVYFRDQAIKSLDHATCLRLASLFFVDVSVTNIWLVCGTYESTWVDAGFFFW